MKRFLAIDTGSPTGESHEAAARLFENHPRFAVFPGDAIEVMECLAIPNT
jgi:hypothetical protein